jgi:hypothetical protein
MKYLVIIFCLTGCASTSTNSKSCNYYQAVEDCQAERNSFFEYDQFSSEQDNYNYCREVVPQCE